MLQGHWPALSAPTDAARWDLWACVRSLFSGKPWELFLFHVWWFCSLNNVCKHRSLWECPLQVKDEAEGSNGVPQPYGYSPTPFSLGPTFFLSFTADIVIKAPVVVFHTSCKSELWLSFGLPACLHSICVLILRSLSLLPPPAIRCLFALESMGLPWLPQLEKLVSREMCLSNELDIGSKTIGLFSRFVY